MVQMEQAVELAQEPQMAKYIVQDAAWFVCPPECMPRLLIENVLLKSRMNQEVHVRFCEEQGVKISCIPESAFVLLPGVMHPLLQSQLCL